MKQRITYGIYGMMEYLLVIPLGKASLKVRFSEGSFSSMSQRPASYTTDSPLIQHAIEGSVEFAKGLIRRVRVIDIDEPAPIKTTKAPTSTTTPTPATTPTSPTPPTALKSVDVDGNDAARDYLEKNFSAVRNRIRTRAEIIAFAREVGVSFNFKN